ncbi:hypothetical protein HG537_0B03990 [Torulaspora globosa]|uniref:Guanine nucleotide-binding protein subunit gamma n=1 Tax=Torulaspora globosa TaxID=48254 RepID=A0A7H9HRT4_9SACH|nr:hypothetical protein HG537_0B03990 [Torulaspora sp. CBS 2947]
MSQEVLSYRIQCLKLKRVNELNNRLRDELGRERITASNACLNFIDYVSTHTDYTLPEIWGYPSPGSNPFANGTDRRRRSRQDTSGTGFCCNIM